MRVEGKEISGINTIKIKHFFQYIVFNTNTEYSTQNACYFSFIFLGEGVCGKEMSDINTI